MTIDFPMINSGDLGVVWTGPGRPGWRDGQAALDVATGQLFAVTTIAERLITLTSACG